MLGNCLGLDAVLEGHGVGSPTALECFGYERLALLGAAGHSQVVEHRLERVQQEVEFLDVHVLWLDCIFPQVRTDRNTETVGIY